MVVGMLITCTVMAFTLGKMAVAMKANTLMIKSMALELIFGLMAEGTLGSGSMENSMVKGDTYCRVESRDLGYGRMENA